MATDPFATALLLAGPTASGKSSLAVHLAERTGGVVVNADSMQVYRDLRIITARPSEDDEWRVPHELFGHVDGAQAYSVARWLSDVARVREAADGRPLIVAGGTGLYFEALTRGLSDVPPIPTVIRDRARHLATTDPDRLRVMLAERDRTSANSVAPGDAQRLARAWEVLEATGRPLHAWQGERTGQPGWAQAAPRFVLAPDRTTLRERIRHRLDRMAEEGAVREVGTLIERGLDPALPVMRAIGVRQFGAHVRGECTLAESVDATATATGQYAKRQETWFRNRFGSDWLRIGPEDDALPVFERALLTGLGTS